MGVWRKPGYRFLTALVPLAILIVFSAVLLALPGCDKKTGDEEAQDQAGDGRVGVLIVLKGRATVFRGDRTITVRRRYFLEPEDRVRTGPKAKVQVIYFAPLKGSAFIATRKTEFVVRDGGWFGAWIFLRCSFRTDYGPSTSGLSVGFRLVRLR